MDFLNTEEKRQRRLVHLPMGRFGEAVEIAQAALFCEYFSLSCAVFFFPEQHSAVASDESSYVTVRVLKLSSFSRKCWLFRVPISPLMEASQRPM